MAKTRKTAHKKDFMGVEAEVKIEDFCARMGLEILHRGARDSFKFTTLNINRPGLQLAGFFEHFAPERIQVMGEQEKAYIDRLPSEERLKACEKLFAYDIPCLVVSTVLEPCDELMQTARKFDRTVLRSKLRTTMIMNELSIYLNELLAPMQSIHGVLMDIYGVGVLIIGNSSIGKSETALELIQRNHRLVADDAVVIKRIQDKLVGTSPAIIRYFMEVRGIGIIDIRSMYGSGAVKLTKVIDMVIKLEEWDSNREYDRLGNVKETYTLLDVKLPMHVIPVKPGRNLAVILEVAARNNRLKMMGYDALAELDNRIKNRNDDDPFDY